MAAYGTKSCPPWIQPITLAQLGPNPVVPDLVGLYALVIHSISQTHELHLFDRRHVLRVMLSSTVVERLDDDPDDLGLTSTNLVGHVVALDGLRIVADLNPNPPTLVATVEKLTPFCEREKRPVCKMTPIEHDPAIHAALMAKRVDVVKRFAPPSFGAQPEHAGKIKGCIAAQLMLPPKELLANVHDFSRAPRLADASVCTPRESTVEAAKEHKEVEREGCGGLQASEKAVVVARGASPYLRSNPLKANQYERSLSGSSDDDSAPPLSIRDVEISEDGGTPAESGAKSSDHDREFLGPIEMALDGQDAVLPSDDVPIVKTNNLGSLGREPISPSLAVQDNISPDTTHETIARSPSRGSAPACKDAKGIAACSVATVLQSNYEVPDRISRHSANPQAADRDDGASFLKGTTGSGRRDDDDCDDDCDTELSKSEIVMTNHDDSLPDDAFLNCAGSSIGRALIPDAGGRRLCANGSSKGVSTSQSSPLAKPPLNTQAAAGSEPGVRLDGANEERLSSSREASRNRCGDGSDVGTMPNVTRQNAGEPQVDREAKANTPHNSNDSRNRTGTDIGEPNVPRTSSGDDFDALTLDEDPTVLARDAGRHEATNSTKATDRSAVGVLTQTEIMKVGAVRISGTGHGDIPQRACLTQAPARGLDMNTEDLDDDQDIDSACDEDVGSWGGQNLNLETQQMIVSDSEETPAAKANPNAENWKHVSSGKSSGGCEGGESPRDDDRPSVSAVEAGRDLQGNQHSSQLQEQEVLMNSTQTNLNDDRCSVPSRVEGALSARDAMSPVVHAFSNAGSTQETETDNVARTPRFADRDTVADEVIVGFEGAGHEHKQKTDGGTVTRSFHEPSADEDSPKGRRTGHASHAYHAPRLTQVSQPGQISLPSAKLLRVTPRHDPIADHLTNSQELDFWNKNCADELSEAETFDSGKKSRIHTLKESTCDPAVLAMIETISRRMHRLDHLKKARRVNAWMACLAPVSVMRTADDMWNRRFRRQSTPVRRVWRRAGDASESSREMSDFEPEIRARARRSLPAGNKLCFDSPCIAGSSSPGVTTSPQEPSPKRRRHDEPVTRLTEASCAGERTGRPLGTLDMSCTNAFPERPPSALTMQRQVGERKCALDVDASDRDGGWFDKIGKKPESCPSMFGSVSEPATLEARTELCGVAAFVNSSLKSKLDSLAESK